MNAEAFRSFPNFIQTRRGAENAGCSARAFRALFFCERRNPVSARYSDNVVGETRSNTIIPSKVSCGTIFVV